MRGAARWVMGVFVGGALALAGGCTESVDRSQTNTSASTRVLSNGLTLRVEGGAIVRNTEAAGHCPESVVVRAQSFDVRIDIEDSGCAPQVLHLELTHLPLGQVSYSARAFLGALDPVASALGEVVGGGLNLDSDPHEPGWTPLTPERAYQPLLAASETAGNTISWTACLDRNRQAARLLPGRLPIEACRFRTVEAGESTLTPLTTRDCAALDTDPVVVDPNAGACTTFDAEASGALGAAPLIVRHRARLPLEADDCVRFAVWGNNAGDATRRAAIIEQVRQTDAAFVIVTGDLTRDGTPAELCDAVVALDTLGVPWYATLGDREANGAVISTFAALSRAEASCNGAQQFTDLIGASSFAFDAGPTRLVVLDTGDFGLSSTDRRALPGWLDAATRLWWSEPPPPARLVLTHVPPFDPVGARGLAFAHRPEAAGFVAALERTMVPLLFSSQFAVFERQRVAGLEVVHSGGAGAPMETTSNDPNHWLLVTVDPRCPDPPPCATGEGCPCVEVDRVVIGEPVPSLATCRPAAIPAPIPASQ